MLLLGWLRWSLKMKRLKPKSRKDPLMDSKSSVQVQNWAPHVSSRLLRWQRKSNRKELVTLVTEESSTPRGTSHKKHRQKSMTPSWIPHLISTTSSTWISLRCRTMDLASCDCTNRCTRSKMKLYSTRWLKNKTGWKRNDVQEYPRQAPSGAGARTQSRRNRANSSVSSSPMLLIKRMR